METAKQESNAGYPAEGGCACRFVRYRMNSAPMIVHCCHCTWCQRESGASFALNAMIETDRVQVISGEAETIDTPSESGKGQLVVRCPRCRVAVWSHYAGAGRKAAFVRVGTLDNPDLCPPDVHIFTESKQDWVIIPPQARAFPIFYDRAVVWSRDSLKRRAAMMGEAHE
jgi:hypothetical protein